jgi:probable phosphoglycerate mutase
VSEFQVPDAAGVSPGQWLYNEHRREDPLRLLLIRHGESVANTEGRMQGGRFDSPLTARGRDQAKALLKRLQGEGWRPSVVYASDLRRAAETAGILAAGLDAPLILDARLREYDIGVLGGVIWREVEVLYPELWRRLQQDGGSPAIPGEEGFDALHGRLSSMVAGILAAHHEGETIAVVAHGGSLGMILAHLLHLDPRRPLPFTFGNVSFSVVEISALRTRLVLMNDTSHVDGKHLSLGAVQEAWLRRLRRH